MERIPHRYPMLLVDEVIDIVPGESAVGIKNVSINEPFFPGHFPDAPIMPGVLIIEAMAQSAAVLVVDSLGAEAANKLVYFMTIDATRFRKPVLPGHRLELRVAKQKARGAIWKFRGEAIVEGQVMAESLFSAMLVDRPAPD